MQRKGQAALEFLTTYGWAFLVILVMIGALAYFGVLDPQKYLPQRCQFGTELQCEQYTLDSTPVGNDIARFQLRNSFPDDIYVDNIQWKSPETDDTGYTDCDNMAGFAGVTIGHDSINTVECQLPDTTLKQGTKQRVQFKITYSKGGTGYNANFANDVLGELYANVR